MPTPSTSSSGTLRGIDVASEAVEASRTGASDRATRSATSARSCSTSTRRAGTAGSVDHSRPVWAPDCRAASTIAAWRGTSASVSASQTTLIPASGQCSSSSASWAGSGSSRPSRTARIHGQRRAVRSRSGTAMRNSATSSSRATSSSAAAVVAATWSPGSGEVTERRWGSHFIHGARPDSVETAAAMVRSSGLCRQADCTTSAEATPSTSSGEPCTPNTPISARSTVIGTPETSVLPAAAASASSRRSSSPPVSIGALTSVGTVPRPTRSRRKSGALASARPEVGRAQLGAASQVGEVGGGAQALDALLVDERRQLLAPRPRARHGTPRGRGGTCAAPSDGPRSSWRRARAATSASGRGTAAAG